MRTPTEYEIEELYHYAVGYDPIAAKKYYEEHKHLKGRKPGSAQPAPIIKRTGLSSDPRAGKTKEQIHKDARAHQRQELTALIGALTQRLNKLEALIKKRETEERQSNSKSKAKKERAVKEKNKPKTAAEKAQASRDAAKYRDKHKQELKTKAHDKKSGGGSGHTKKGPGKHTSSELRSLATKVRGQIALAKQKLAAL